MWFDSSNSIVFLQGKPVGNVKDITVYSGDVMGTVSKCTLFYGYLNLKGLTDLSEYLMQENTFLAALEHTDPSSIVEKVMTYYGLYLKKCLKIYTFCNKYTQFFFFQVYNLTFKISKN